MTEQQPLNREGAARRYTELQHLIAIGAYTEDSEDGTLWVDDQDISTEIDSLEARADGEDLKFVATHIDQTGRHVYILEELSPDEKQEKARQRDALRAAGLAAAFRWQDRGKIVLDMGAYVLGSVPDQAGAYVVRIDAEVRENDPMMTYSWEEQETLLVTRDAEGKPVTDDATEEHIAQARAYEEAHGDAAAAIREWARASFTAISTAPEESLSVRVDLLRLERKGDQWEALLAIAGGRFNLRVTFRLDDEKRLHIESQKQEYPEEEDGPVPDLVLEDADRLSNLVEDDESIC